MDKTEILNIVNEPSKHIQIVKIDGKYSIVYSSKFVELLELIPTMLTKTDMEQIRAEIMQLYNEVEVVDYDHNDISRIKKAHWIIREEVLWIIDKYTHYSYCEECLRKDPKALKSLDELYQIIYDHHHEITLTEDSEYKRGLLSLSKWVLDLMTSNFDCEYKAEINPQESEEEDETTENTEN